MPSSWLSLFEQSKANGAEYDGDKLPAYPWAFPRNTWLQRRLAELKREENESQ